MRLLPRSFRGQLVLSFLALSLIPSLVLTMVATWRLLDAVERWEQPGVQKALTGSFQVSRDLVTRLENDLRQRAQLLAADPVLDAPRDAGALAERLASAYNLDFAQLYDASGALLLQATRDPLIAPPGPLAGAVAAAVSGNPVLQDRERHLLAHAEPVGDVTGGGDVLVVGVFLDRDFYDRLDDLSQAVGYYGMLRTLITVNQGMTLAVTAIGLVLLAVAAVVVARRLARRLTRPVESLAGGMASVARGDEAHLEPEGGEEFERLIATFNTMSEELARSRELLAQAERQSAWRDVARRVAHEMRNALTPIGFSLHRVRKAAGELPEDRREALRPALESILEEVEGLKRLAASFSELARLPAPEMRRVDLGALLAASTAAASDERVAIRFTPPDAPVIVRGDASLLRQAVTNLLRNGSEAMPDGGTIWVALRAGDDGVEIAIEDDGPGWPREDREALLEPYVTTKAEGTGLGLSLVRRTLFQHGGSVALGDRPGGGARVTLYLPSESPPPAGGSKSEEPRP